MIAVAGPEGIAGSPDADRQPQDQQAHLASQFTFEAWYDAAHGTGSFAGLGLIPTGAWHDYLQWYRRVLELPVRNGVAATAIAPAELDDGGGCLLVTLSTGEVLAARKLVLATGQDGTGEWWMPDFVRALPADRRAHTCEIIDFERLRGRTVAVLGAGASAMDNAAVALEHGAEVHLFCRRAEPSVVQRYRWLTFAGFLKHIGEMPDEWRWRVMGNIMRAREGFPADTYQARAGVSRLHHAARPHRGPMPAWRMTASGSRRRAGRSMPTTRSAAPASARTCGCAPNWRRSPTRSRCGAIATRRRRARRIRCSRPIPISVPTTPSSNASPGEAPWLADIHLFGIGSTLSFGPSGSSINAMTTAVPKVVAGVTRGLFAGDLQRHWESLLAYDVKQVELDWSRMARG